MDQQLNSYNPSMIILQRSHLSGDPRASGVSAAQPRNHDPDQIKRSSIRRGGEQPAVGLVGRMAHGDPNATRSTEKARTFLAVDARPMFEEAVAAGGSADAEVEAEALIAHLECTLRIR